MTRRRKKQKRKEYLVVTIIVVIVSAILLYFLLHHTILPSKKKSKYLKELDEYGYILEERDSSLMKNVFDELEIELKKDKVDYERYAECLSKLFIIDLYTIDNKLSRYDVGSTQFIYPESKESFKAKVEDTLYKYVKIKEKRKDAMPIVKEINVDNIDTDTYEYNEKKFEAYVLSLSWKYKKDLGYDDKGTVTLIKEDNKLYVAEFSPEVKK